MGPLAASLAVLLAGAGTASGTVFSLQETYDVTNFFNKFEFFESKFDTGDFMDQDPNHGFVNYKNRKEAFASGLIKYGGEDVYIGVDSENKWWSPDGRPSIRLESKKDYAKGLFIARFNHLPKTACGAWPAFWTYSQVGQWPHGGEVDIYENWNLATQNHPTFHTGNVTDVGRCIIDTAGSTGSPLRPDCSHDDTNIGCNVVDTNGPWATSDGGIYAMEWTDSYIRVFTWSHADAPSNIDSRHPDTATWGKPVIEVHDGPCNIKRQFGPQKLILNIDFCGDAAGSTWSQECGPKTGESECYRYVRNHPEEYKDVYFKVKDIRYFEQGFIPDPTSSSTTTSSTSTSSSTTTLTTTSTTSSTTSTSTTSSVPTSTSTSSFTSSTPTASSSSSATVTLSSSSSDISSSTTPVPTSSSSATSSTTTTDSSSSSTTTSDTTSSVPLTTTSDSSSSGSNSATTSPTSSLATSSSPVSTSSSTTDATSSPVTSSSSSSEVPTISSPALPTSSSSTEATSSSSTAITTDSSSSASTHSTSTSSPSTSSPAGTTTTTTTTTSAPVPTGSSSTTSAPAATTPSEAWTTSVVYTTTTYTVTSCAPAVTDCPGKGRVVTETIPLYTTVCPVTPAATAAPGLLPETVTAKVVTKVYTITSCAPTVTDCPVGKLTTEVVTSTACPGCSSNNNTDKPGAPSSSTGCHGGDCATGAPVMMEESTSLAAPSSVPKASSAIPSPSSTGVSAGASSVATSASSHVAASASSQIASTTGIVASSTHQPTGTQTRIPMTGLASPSKSMSKTVAVVAGMLAAALLW